MKKNIIKKKSKKAQGLSLTTIIVAAIVLIVLVVLVIIFGSKMHLFGTKYDSSKKIVTDKICATTKSNNGDSFGKCVDKSTSCTEIKPGTEWIDCSGSQKCCSKKSITEQKTGDDLRNMPVP